MSEPYIIIHTHVQCLELKAPLIKSSARINLTNENKNRKVMSRRLCSAVLMPGSRIFEVFRIGHEALCCTEGEKEDACPGRAQQVKGMQPEVMFDFRCHAPGGDICSPAKLNSLARFDVITRGALRHDYTWRASTQLHVARFEPCEYTWCNTVRRWCCGM